MDVMGCKICLEEAQEDRTLKGPVTVQHSSVRRAKGLVFGPRSISRVAVYWKASKPRRRWTELSGKQGKPRLDISRLMV